MYLHVAVPGCKLFCREINSAISACHRNSKSAKVPISLRKELEYWICLDSWSVCSKWRSEFHKRIELYTDAFEFKFGTSVKLENGATVLGDYWENDDCRRIHVREANAVLKSLQSLSGVLQNHRVEVLSDSKSVIGSWKNPEGNKDLLIV